MRDYYPLIDNKRTGENLRKIIKLRNVTVKEIQEYLGLSTAQAIYHWLNGRSLPSIDNLYALSMFLKVSIDELICGNREQLLFRKMMFIRVQTYMEHISGMLCQ